MDSLGLIGDGDELDLVHTIERVFGVTFTAEDYAVIRTVGDVESSVWQYLQARAPGQTRCATASAFYELRRALSHSKHSKKIAPNTPLAAIGLSPTRISWLIRRRSRLALRFPATRLSAIGCWLGIIGFLVATIATAITNSGAAFAVGAGFMVVGLLAMHFDPRQFGAMHTVGDAARELANWNFGAFLSRGARLNRTSVWHAIRVVIAENVGCRMDGIRPDTLIIRRRRKQRERQI